MGPGNEATAYYTVVSQASAHSQVSTKFQGTNEATSIQTCVIYIPGKVPMWAEIVSYV